MRKTFLLCLMLLAIPLWLFSQNQEKKALQIFSDDYKSISFAVDASGSFNKFNVNTSKGLFTEIALPDFGTSLKPGLPKLPVLKQLIEIPYDAQFDVQILSYTEKEYSLSELGIENMIFPSQPSLSKSQDPSKVPFIFNATEYQKDEYLSHEIVQVIPVGIMRGVRLARLEVAPVFYNPVQKKLKVLENIQVQIVYKNADVAKTISEKQRLYSPTFESSFGAMANYKSIPKDSMVSYPVTYVIVSPITFQSALQPFIQWKTKKGFKVIEAYTNNPAVGTTTTSIKAYLQGLHTGGTPSNPAPSFVLIVGDIAQVPAFSGTAGSHVTDLYYCEYNGDLIPDCYYGRFSATSTAQLQPQIDKTLEYEQYLMPDPTFLSKCVMVSGVDGSYAAIHGNGQINYGTDTYFNSSNGLTSYTYLYPASGSSSAAIINNVSEGVCFANYTAHGGPTGWSDPAFSNSDVATLGNNHKYPLMVGNCCLTNKFDETECFGEALLRANGKGAIGYIGGSNSTYWNEDFYWGVGYRTTVTLNPVYSSSTLGSYDRAFHTHGEPFVKWFPSQGQMNVAGNLAVTQSGSSLDYYWEIYHLMGDPSLMVYFSIPPAMTVTYNPAILIGATTFTVTSEPYSYVGLSMNNVLYGAALSDASGIATITISPAFTVPGVANVVVTKQNRQPYIGTVNIIAPSGPYVVYDAHTINDAAGNNNSLADYNESVLLNVTLENVGINNASGVSAKLRSTDAYVTITDSTGTWGTINTGLTSTQNNVYAFTVDNYVPDGHSALFSLVVTDGSSNTWTSTFSIILNAPLLTIGNMSVSDPTGNNNGRLDPGETADIIIQNTNAGHTNITNPVGKISSASTWLTINSATSTIATLNSGSTQTTTYNVTVSAGTPTGTAIPMLDSLVFAPYSVAKTFSATVGIVSEDWECNGFTHYSWVNSSAIPWTITGTSPYEGLYCAKSGTITDSQQTDLSITMTATGNDSISFYYKVSSESGWDFLKFNVDGVEKGSWSGEEGWARAAYPIATGSHTYLWSYVKDYSVANGSDAAWVDYIIFPPMNGPIGIEDNNSVAAFGFYPNPANGSAMITFDLKTTGNVNIDLYDATGRTIKNLWSESTAAGDHQIMVDVSALSPGIYFCRLITENGSRSLRFIKN
ncbi:MAG: C25 family cysteine peptidase [Bacteroidota bacterium]